MNTENLELIGSICSILSLIISVIALVVVSKVYFSVNNTKNVSQRIKGDSNTQTQTNIE